LFFALDQESKMKFKYHNIFWVFLSATVLIIVFFSIDINEERLNQATDIPGKTEETKNGLVKTFASDGKLKTEITYVNGTKHGKSVLYYGDGKTVQLEMTYQKGKRQGTSKKYFETGQLYAETSYEKDTIHGVRKLYNRKGQLKAEIPYGYGFPGTGLAEYLLTGKQKENPKISKHQELNRLYFSTTPQCRDQRFYVGKLIEEQFFNALDEDLELLLQDGDDFFIDLNIYTPSYLKYQDIICVCKSTQGNPMILKEGINTLSLKKVN